MIFFVSLQVALLVCAVLSQGDASTIVSCPTWFVPVTDFNITTCKCGPDFARAVDCSEALQQVGVLHGYCMTYWNSMNSLVFGRCPYNLLQRNVSSFYLLLPSNVSELNDYMCGNLNREGLLCGQCKSGFSPAVFSLDNRCLRCTDGAKNWAIFLSVTLLPTTVFFLLVIIFRINANAPPLSAFVLFSQLSSSPDLIASVLGVLKSIGMSSGSIAILKSFYTIYGVWSLDFLRTVIPPYCLPGITNSTQALAIEYLVAFYPLLLVLFAYLCIKMHDHNFRPVVVVWKPFHRCFVKLTRSWDPNASIANTFATFLLLSYWKITYVSFHLLTSTDLYVASERRFESQHFYYDASEQLFHGSHLPFALLAVGIIATFVVLPPIFLCLYPTRTFQKFLWYARIRGHGMVAFMDVLQGAYKDGSEGTHDWRFMSGAYFLLRILVLAVSSSVGTAARMISIVVAVLVFITFALVLAIMRPYKSNVHNIIDSLVLAVIALLCFLAILILMVIFALLSFPLWLFVIFCFVFLAPLLLLGGFVCSARKSYFLSIWKKLKRLCSSAGELNDVNLLESQNDLSTYDRDYRQF